MTTLFIVLAVLLVASGASIARTQHILADLAKHIEQQEVAQ